MATDEAARRRAGKIIYQERARRGWSVETAMDIGGIGHMTWRRVERGDPVQAKSYRAVDRAFDWPLGHTHAAIEAGSDLLDSENQPKVPLRPEEVDTEPHALAEVEEQLEGLSYLQLKNLQRTVSQIVNSYDEKIRQIHEAMKDKTGRKDNDFVDAEHLEDLPTEVVKQYTMQVYEYSNLCRKMSSLATQMMELVDDQENITMTKLDDMHRRINRTREDVEEASLKLDETENKFRIKTKQD